MSSRSCSMSMNSYCNTQKAGKLYILQFLQKIYTNLHTSKNINMKSLAQKKTKVCQKQDHYAKGRSSEIRFLGRPPWIYSFYS